MSDKKQKQFEVCQKAHGTRVGMLQDWREGSTRGKLPRRKANALRDGR